MSSELFSITDEESDYSEASTDREPQTSLNNSFVKINYESEQKKNNKSVKRRLYEKENNKKSMDKKWKISPMSNIDLLKFYQKTALSSR